MSLFTSQIVWTGNCSTGTSAYDRTWTVRAPGKTEIHSSNDPALGRVSRLRNPVDMLLNALSACHLLWFLHMARDTGLVVTVYTETSEGRGDHNLSGIGRYLSATLSLQITLSKGMKRLSWKEKTL
ncbi:MAG: OsmC family peroxiredoxin [Pseudomonadota bacterium]